MKRLCLLLATLTCIATLRANIRSLTIRVKGMTCEICATNVRKQLKTMKPVASLDKVDYTDGTVQMTLKPRNKATRVSLEKEFKKRISKAGFTFEKILEVEETK